MNFFNPSLKPDNQQFAQLVSEKRFKDLYQWHKQYTPWVSDALIVQYVEEYRQQVMQADAKMKAEEEQKQQDQKQLEILQQQLNNKSIEIENTQMYIDYKKKILEDAQNQLKQEQEIENQKKLLEQKSLQME